MKFRLLPIAAATLGLALGGCSADLSGFSVADLNPMKGNDPLRSADYNYFYKRDQSATSFVSSADLVGPDGRCAFSPAPALAAGAPEPMAETPAAAPINPRSNQALYFTAGPETGRTGRGAQAAIPPEIRGGPRGIAVGMTECQVVQVAGYTDRVEIGANERGQRSVMLAYMSGERPGIYRFVSGRLVSMERVAEPPQPKKPQKAAKSVKKSPQQ
jgi:hypothetical protein